MNKKFTLPVLLLFLFTTIHLHAQDIVKICINTQLSNPVGLVEFTLSGTNATQIGNDTNGCYQFEVDQTSGTLNLSLKKDINPLNGVDIADLFVMASGILGTNPFTPLQLQAGDTNGSETLTTFDMVVTRRLILNIDSDFPINTDSWHFFEPNFSPSGAPVGASEIQIATPINGTQTINVIGIKTGDVNLSADPSMFASQSVDVRSGDLVFKTLDQTLTTDEVFDVPFTSNNFSQIKGYQFTTQFDADALEFQEVILGALLPNHSLNSDFNLINSDEGIINTLWVNASTLNVNLSPDEVIFTIRFKAKTNVVLSEVLDFNSASTLAVAYNTLNEPLDIILEFDNETTSAETLNNGFKLKPNFPNPFQVSTQIDFILPTDEYVRLEIINALGQVVMTLVDGKESAGEHQIIFSPNNLNTGIYFSRLIVGKNQSIQKMIYLP